MTPLAPTATAARLHANPSAEVEPEPLTEPRPSALLRACTRDLDIALGLALDPAILADKVGVSVVLEHLFAARRRLIAATRAVPERVVVRGRRTESGTRSIDARPARRSEALSHFQRVLAGEAGNDGESAPPTLRSMS